MVCPPLCHLHVYVGSLHNLGFCIYLFVVNMVVPTLLLFSIKSYSDGYPCKCTLGMECVNQDVRLSVLKWTRMMAARAPRCHQNNAYFEGISLENVPCGFSRMLSIDSQSVKTVSHVILKVLWTIAKSMKLKEPVKFYHYDERKVGFLEGIGKCHFQLWDGESVLESR